MKQTHVEMDDILRTVIFIGAFGLLSGSESLQINSYQNDSAERFSAANCMYGRISRPVNLKSLSIEPDPIQLGSDIFVNVSFRVAKPVGLSKRLEADLSIRLLTPDKPTEVCDLVGEKFCHFTDLCKEIHNRCPPEIRFICNCPILKGNYTFDGLKMPLGRLPFELRASFDVTVDLKEQGTSVGCIDAHFCIGKCKPWKQ